MPRSSPPALMRRAPLQFPSRAVIAGLDPEMGACERAAEHALPHMSSSNDSSEHIAAVLRENHCRDALTHRLSGHWMAHRPGNGSDRVARCMTTELARYRLAMPVLVDAVLESEPLHRVENLQQACALLTGSNHTAFRDRDVGLEPGTDGRRVMFGPWNEVPARVLEYFGQLEVSSLPPAFKAIVAMAVMLNIHPFFDGNGRTARALFCVMLGISHGKDLHLPLHLILEHSQGGFELRLREAEILGDWRPLLSYFTTVFNLVAKAAELTPTTP